MESIFYDNWQDLIPGTIIVDNHFKLLWTFFTDVFAYTRKEQLFDKIGNYFQIIYNIVHKTGYEKQIHIFDEHEFLILIFDFSFSRKLKYFD